jgi:hypothetical protein
MYDDPKYGVDHVIEATPSVWANDANGIIAQLKLYKKVKVKECSAVITGEVFNDGTIVVKLDDTSIGDIIVTTKTQGEITDASLTDTDVSSTSSLVFECSVATATGQCSILVQYQELFE